MKNTYERPELIELGNAEQVTLGATGPRVDSFDMGTEEPYPYPPYPPPG